MEKRHKQKYDTKRSFPICPTAYGGDLRSKRRGRSARPIAIKKSMHLVLRSTQARGAQSFRRYKNDRLITNIMGKFCEKYGVHIIHHANSGNHLHIHVKLTSRINYVRFIRAVTGAIAMAITGASRLKKLKKRFWDRRPFSRIVLSAAAFKRLNDYITINIYEGMGYTRGQARAYVILSG